jgi:DNA-binding transcriptional ArsR family regulator
MTERAENLVSQHARALRTLGLAASRRDGKMVLYRARPDWEMGRPSSPESAWNSWNLRSLQMCARPLQSREFAAFSASFERSDRTTENRGVPGSSPGLAIAQPVIPHGC